jgi:hypothetical protein
MRSTNPVLNHHCIAGEKLIQKAPSKDNDVLFLVRKRHNSNDARKSKNSFDHQNHERPYSLPSNMKPQLKGLPIMLICATGA